MDYESQPLVTIGIPTYNRAAGTLAQALESALAQTYTNIEIAISDNASPDHTSELIAGYEDPRIRYFRHPENIGSNGNFNHCLKMARGEYFVLLSDDDLLDPDFVESCIGAIGDRRDVGFVLTGTRMVDASGRERFSRPNRSQSGQGVGLLEDWYAKRLSFYLCSLLYSTTALREAGGFRSLHNLLEDVVACCRIAATHPWLPVREVKAAFRQHESNRGTAIDTKAWCEDSLDLLDLICRLFPDQPPDFEARGKRFLCLMNYSIVRSQGTFWRRMVGYFRVAKDFDYVASPWRNAVYGDIKGSTKRRLRDLVISVVNR